MALTKAQERGFWKKRIAELEKENTELKKLFANCDTCKRTCDMGNCCKFGSAYLPDVEKTLNKQKQLTKAKEIIKTLLLIADNKVSQMEFHLCVADAKQFLNSEVEK